RHCGDSPESTGPRSVDLPASPRGGVRRMRCRPPVGWLSSGAENEMTLEGQGRADWWGNTGSGSGIVCLQRADDMLTLNAVWPPTNEKPAFGRLIRLARRTANGGADARPGAMRYEKA